MKRDTNISASMIISVHCSRVDISSESLTCFNSLNRRQPSASIYVAIKLCIQHSERYDEKFKTSIKCSTVRTRTDALRTGVTNLKNFRSFKYLDVFVCSSDICFSVTTIS